MNAPVWGIPPDLEVEELEYCSLALPKLWHLPPEKWDAIWAKFSGEKETVAILDTGYRPHTHLPKPIAERSFIKGQTVSDGNAHGTHCAGTAIGRNGLGVAPGANLIVGKCLSDQGSGASDGITDSINWAIDSGATIISMSLGGGSPYEPTRRAIERANQAGVLVCASAGNSGQRLPNNTIGYPGRFLESYCSGSKDEQGKISSFSSAGRELDGVTPGSRIISSSNTDPNGYKTMSGTSMSCPFAAGLFAVIRSGMAKAGMKRLGGIEDWRPWLQQFFLDQGPVGHDPIWGWGIPDYEKIVNFLAQPEIKWV